MDTDDSSVFSFSTSAAVGVWLESLILYIRALNYMGVYRADEQEELHGALYELSYYTLEVLSAILLIALHGPGCHDDADAEEGEHLMGYFMETAATDEDGADGIDEIVHGVDVGGQIGPLGHRSCRGE